MEDQAKKITEMFAAPRGELQLVTNWGGVKIYTSTKLKQGFVKAMAKTSRTTPIIQTILKLITSGDLVPCYLTDTISKSLLKMQPLEFKGYAGVSFGKKIFVFVEADSNMFGFASNNELSITTLHELVHRVSNDFQNEFFQTFKKELVEYYSYFWNDLFSIKVNELDKKGVEDVLKFVFIKIEKGKHNSEILVQYQKKLLETFQDKTTLNQETFYEIVKNYIVFINIVWKAMDAGAPSMVYKAATMNRNIVSLLYTAYTKTFGINIKHIKEFCVQELYAPSEVISVPALMKRPDQKVYKMINKL